ncbi:hypothetical protein BOX15_Mlig018280g2 [Macrostomum lignano]|uniref:Potassium channel domain-containing protein n=3 Tax=Macrostomum lignano TaxID=282301 RepID=A0A267FK89_9PLAT|nr:hypothetical protein BOX15_Mlig018280g2 [Macrostomum lignano]
MYSNSGFEADTFGEFGGKTSAGFDVRRDGGFRTTALNGEFGGFEPAGKKPELEVQEEDEEQQQQKKSKMNRCMKRFSSIMLSHLGTFLIVVLYTLMGGFLFQYLEVENEISGCQTKSEKFIAKLDESVDQIYNIAQGTNATQAKSAIQEELNQFAQDTYTLGVDPSMNCTTLKTGESMPSWNVANAAYFCVTIITTIGYGHISPVTQWGQIVCMIYSILGIPLMLLFLSKIGEPTAMLFRSFYLNIFCCKCFVKKLPNENKLMEAMQENGGNAQTSWQQVEEGDGKRPPAKVTVIEDDVEEEEENEEDDVVNIPITVTIILLILYILMGAAVFMVWEKEWTLVEGTYFSFITLSTIGFGDYVPGRDGPFNDIQVITELLVGCIYCLFGLAMLSMCINLIQDEIQAKFQWLGRKIGMIKKAPIEEIEDEDEEDDEEDGSSDSGSGSGSDGDSEEDTYEDAKSSKTGSTSAAPTSARSKAASSSFA